MAKYVSKYTGEEIESILDKSTISYTKPSEGIPKSDLSSSIQESLNDISNKVDKVSGKQLSTEDFTTALKNKLNQLSNYDDTAVNNAISGIQSQINTLVSGNASTAIESFNEIIAFLNGITDSQSLDNIIASIEQQIAEKMDKVTLAKVATSGSYNDLSNKPTIPSAVTESTVSGWGFTKNTGTYSKPSAGIPKADLASAVQTSLGKADTALQSYTEKYTGTVTGVKINGTTKNPSSGVVDLGYINKQLSTSTSSSMTLSPNIYYRNTSTSLSTLTIKLGSVSNSNIINEYFVEFTTSSSGTTVSLPSTIKWANEEAPTFEASTTYQISIVNNLGTVLKFK